jgi:prepilin-type N-terminal cleavage/methylation domain-containing protein
MDLFALLKIKSNYKLRITDYELRRQSGFTLIELLIVIGITLLVGAAAVPIYGSLQVSTQLNENSSLVIQTVRTAREYSVARLNNAAHGVYITSTTYTLYQGSSYAARDSSYDRTTTLDSALTLSTTLTGSEVNFSKGLGVPNNTGTITLTHDVQGSSTITINSFGMVEE